ncbi:MAG: natural resistance-associated macrophage protein [Microgenomates group bacterium Gr01-1014_5]|nr:MAG: natural resistance-associated macrophage protein [Microgenomates group bacterium Gr01-1014_5]
MKKIVNFFKSLGPGLITGASDDDPSGIVIYAQAGAFSGYKLLWTAPFITPFMIAIQEMCARIGMVTGHGLIGTMRRHYPPLLLWIVASSVFIANTINVGADLAAMSSSTQLLLPFSTPLITIFYSALILILLLFFSYRKITNIFRWLTISLLAYVFAAIISKPDWAQVFYSTIIPSISFDRQTLLLIVAMLGTTISPYLFFWQASEEAEDRASKDEIDRRRYVQVVSKGELRSMGHDVTIGMVFSNLVMYFIITTVAATLYKAGIHNLESAEQAALALRPLAGDASFLLFTLGIVGTGLLAIPVLAGSAAYAISEARGRSEGFSTPVAKSKIFYAVLAAATILGTGFTFLGIPPFRALFITGVLYGILSPFLILIVLDLANRKTVMGDKTNGIVSNIFGVAILVLLSAAAVGALVL